MKKIGRLLFGFLFFVTANSAFAKIFCVDTAEEIQAALTTAASNAQDDEVKIVQGEYEGNFVYASTQVNRLSVLGGYNANCTIRTLNPNNTVLDGKKINTVLAISASNYDGDLLIQGITFQNGFRTSGHGGGIFVSISSNSTALISYNVIRNNRAEYANGGGVYVYADIVNFHNNNINDNTSYFVGNGGGIYVADGVDAIFKENNITNNTASFGSGGGVSAHSSVFIKNTITGNHADGGGGGVATSTGHFENNLLIENSAVADGGGVNVGNAYFVNNIFSNNHSATHGGGIAGYSSKLINNTFVANSALEFGGGINLLSDDDVKSIELFNNIFWDNLSTQSKKGADMHIDNDANNDFFPSTVLMLNNNFDHTQPNGFYADIPLNVDPSNLNKVDPHFVDPVNSDLHLQSDSPMIDAGYPGTPDLPEFDIEGIPRVLGASVDIGAYEYDDGSDPRSILTVNKVGTGAGIITSYPTGINCGTDCAHAYEIDMAVMLTATPNANVVFDGWSGNDDCADGSLTMDSHKQCTATFSAARQLTINKTGEGNGTITSNPIGINCGSSCSAWFFQDALVQLTAEADSYSIFSGWTGAADCTDGQVTMATDLTCSATFDQIYYTLMVLFPGTGSGTVTSSPAGIDCGTDCREDYAAGTSVTLTATAAQGSVFNGWAGACSGKSPSCEVEITDLTGVTANFTALETGTTNTLYVTSTGGGTVTSTPIGITCGTQCDADYDSANIVTLTPTPNTGLTFNGWRGACSGTSTCQVPMTLDKAVMAAFGNTYPSQILLLQQEQLVDSSTFAAPRLVVLGPDLTIAAGSNTTVEAGEQIKFLPGFKVEKNATFNARINPTLLP